MLKVKYQPICCAENLQYRYFRSGTKYNPVERTFGSLEQHWSGEILDSEEKVVGFAKTMLWAGKNPQVSIIKKTYENGVKVKEKIMSKLRSGFITKNGIEKWSIVITPNLEYG